MVDPEKVKNIDEKKEEKKPISKKRKRLIVVVSILAIFLIVITAKPSIVGFGVFGDNVTITEEVPVGTIESLLVDLQSAQQNLSLYEQLSDKLRLELDDKSTALTEAVARSRNLEDSQNNFQKTIELLEEKLSEKESELADKEGALEALNSLKDEEIAQTNSELEKLKEDFDVLVESSAKNICCKQKFDNSDIDSYSVINGKILCLEDGDKVLECSFS